MDLPKISKNFAVLTFDTLGDSVDDILILNLVTRHKFWMRTAIIASEIKEKARRLDWNDFDHNSWIIPVNLKVHGMRDENGRVIITFFIKMDSACLWMIL